MRAVTRLLVPALITLMAASSVAIPAAAADPDGTGGASSKTTSEKSKASTLGGGSPAAAFGSTDIGDPNSGPLTHIVISDDLNCAVNHRDDGAVGEFFGDTACGTFLALNGILYGPAFIPFGGNANPRTAWTPVNQTLSGDGSPQHPRRVTTEVLAGTSGVRVFEEDTYVFGQETYETVVRVENRGTGFADFVLYRAADCYLGNDDYGFGQSQPNGIATAVRCVAAKTLPDGTRVPGDRQIEWYPLTSSARYYESHYNFVWSWIGSQEEFPDTVLPPDVYTDNGSGLSWHWGLVAGDAKDFVHLLTVSPSLAGGRECRAEDLAFTRTSGRVTIHYDPRFLWQQEDHDYLIKAGWIAQAVADRADSTLNEYGALGFALPGQLNAFVRCDPAFFDLVSTHRDGHVDGQGVFKVRADFLRTNMIDYVDRKVQGLSPSIAHTDVADLIDHELVHVVQVEQEGVISTAIDAFFAGDIAVTEGSAVLGQDLISDHDDDHPLPDSDPGYRSRSFLGTIRDFLERNVGIDFYSDPNGRDPYTVAAFYQYLAEQRAGATNHLEQHGAAFMRALIEEGTHFDAVRHAMGASSSEAVLDALRDFYVTLYVREKANASALPFRFRILDEITAHDQQAATGSGLPRWGALTTPSPTLPAAGTLVLDELDLGGSEGIGSTEGGVYDVSLPAGATEVRLTVEDHPDTPIGLIPFERMRLGFVPVNASNQVAIDPGMFQLGPAIGGSDTYDVPVVGMTALAIAVVNGHYRGDWKITVETRVGAPAVTMDAVPTVGQDDLPGGIQAFVHPSVDGVASHGLPTRSYSATIDGSFAIVSSTFDLAGTQMLFVKPIGALAVGPHTLTIAYGSSSASRTFQVQTGGGGTHAPVAMAGSSLRASSAAGGSLATVLQVGGAAQAGLPIDISFILADGGEGLPGATVVATLTDPLGATRQVPLADNGGPLDSGASDGAFGVQAFGTDLAGLWTVRVDASGTSRAGLPFSLSESATIALGPKVDADGDGVADALEAGFGMSPSDSSDGARDIDGDGASIAVELAAGSDPRNPDTDSGLESDGSEIAAGLSPLLSSDDRAVVSPWLAALPIDGRSIRVQVAAADQATPAHVYRVAADGTSVDLGIRSGAGETFVDGPLAAGQYDYRAVVEMPSGARAVPATFGPFEALDDATPPTVRILLNDNGAATNSTLFDVRFVDLSENVDEMRVADSLAGLEAAAWQPFSPLTTIEVAPGDGSKYVFAQVRDASGLASPVAESGIILDTVAPTSAANAIPAIATGTSVDITFSAADARSTIDIVELWSRSRAASLDPWGPWTHVGFGVTGPITYDFPGDGQFEFATVAVDLAGNREPGPSSADTATIVDHVAPTSSVGALPPTVVAGSLAVPYTASDVVSSVSTVELWWRYRLAPSDPWSDWTLGPSATSSPIPYTFASGDGYYEFYSVAIDGFGNREAPPETADATTQHSSGNSISALSDAHGWLGLKNGDEQGTNFDLRVELLKNGDPVASGLTRCITSVTRNPTAAKEAIVPWAAFPLVPVAEGDVLAVRVSARIGTNPNDTKCAGHNSATGVRFYYDATNRSSRFDVTIGANSSADLYLHSDGAACNNAPSVGVTTRYLDTSAPVASAAKCKDAATVNFAGGNKWSEIGTWSLAPLP